MLLEEMVASAQLKQFDSEVVQPDGSRVVDKVARAGSFIAIDHQGRYLDWLSGRNLLQVLPRQPHRVAQQSAASWHHGDSDTLLVDPSRGNLLKMLSQQPSLLERVKQGGLVGYVIIALGGLGLLVAVWRLLVSLVVK